MYVNNIPNGTVYGIWDEYGMVDNNYSSSGSQWIIEGMSDKLYSLDDLLTIGHIFNYSDLENAIQRGYFTFSELESINVVEFYTQIRISELEDIG